MKDMLLAGGALLSVIIAIWQMISYLNQGKTVDTQVPLVLAILFGIIAIVCGALFLSGRVNKNEDIHVTE